MPDLQIVRRASEAPLRQGNRSLRDENQRLRAENTALKDALAYGERRRTSRLAPANRGLISRP